MAFLRAILGLMITALIAALAVMNREQINFTWSPLHDPLNMPFYAVLLFSMAFGFVFGGAVVWLNMSSLRRQKREQKKEIKTLEKEVEKLHEKQLNTPPAREFFTALPPRA
jgi:uncharacterized integral membrane protein